MKHLPYMEAVYAVICQNSFFFIPLRDTNKIITTTRNEKETQ